MAYVLHLDFADFAAQIDPNGVAFIQRSRSTERYGGVPSSVTAQIVVAGHDRDGRIHAGRIIVERASLLAHDQQAVIDAVLDRAAAAQRLVERALPCRVRDGLLLAAGMYDDLNRVETSHDLWRWTGDTRDVLARQLVAAGEGDS